MVNAPARTVNEEFIRAAFERCPSGLLVADTQGRIVTINEEVERLLGYPRDELLGQPVEVLIPERFAIGHVAQRLGYAKHPIARPMGAGRELYAKHRHGHEIPVEIGLSTIETQDGVFVLATIVNVTERRKLEERLRQTHKLEAIGSLASGIAHDFNNILLGIIGYTELVRESIKDTAVLDDLDVVLGTAQRGRELVTRILSFSRQSEPNRTRLSIATPVRDALQLLGATLPRNIELRQAIDPDTPMLIADVAELHQIVMNLAANASHAMKGRGGVLEVRAAPITADRNLLDRHPELAPGLYVRLSVTDTGTGIPADLIPRIFDPFFTTKPTGEGTGLGLSVIARIVRSLGGCIEVTSKVGVGTKFDVYLPSSLGKTEATSTELAESHDVPCVLYVEDEEQLAKLGKRILERLPLTVVSLTSSLLALEAFRADPSRFALVITDNTMPHMTGLELIAKILEIRPDTPILMVSGIGDTMSTEELRERGVRRLLPKPFLASELRDAVIDLVIGHPSS